MKLYKSATESILYILATFVYIFLALVCALMVRIFQREATKPRLVWGSTPIINNYYWSQAARLAGFSSETFMGGFYIVNKKEDWDRVLSDEYSFIPRVARPFAAFIHSLFLYDVFFISYDGFFLGHTHLWFTQAFFLKLAQKKVVVLSYGSDSYIYARIRSVSLLHGLLYTYPMTSRQQDRIEANVKYWNKYADAVIPGFMGPDGFGKWDVLIPCKLFIDLDMWAPSTKNSNADGETDEVVIVHSTNHRSLKGTEFIVNAVETLQKEGLKVRLLLLEGVQNQHLKNILKTQADILVEQVIMTGHGMSALEGLASGLPVVSNLEDDSYILHMRRWSYFSECPIVSGTPESLVDVLRKLVTRPQLRHELGRAGRAYAIKYQGIDSAQYLFTKVIDFIYKRRKTLIDLYHPLTSYYVNRSPKIHHSLENNQITN